MRRTVPTFDEVCSTIRRWFNPTTLVASRLRDTLVGVIVTVGLAEVCLHRLLHHHIAAGELPAYTTDALIVCYCVVEACVSPLVSWWGFRARRRLLIAWSCGLTAWLTTWFLLRTPGERETDLCNSPAPEGSFSAARLLILLASGPVLVAARAAVWSHGLAYIEDHAPERIPLHYSVFVLARVLPLLIGVGMVDLIDSNVPAQVALFLLGMVACIIQLMVIVPKQHPKVMGEVKSPPPMNDRGFSVSFLRVIRNPLVTSQALATSLLAAALWGSGYYTSDVVKVKYSMVVSRSIISNMTDMLQYYFLIVAVAFAGIHFSPPLWSRFSRTKAVKYALGMSVGVVLLLVLLMISSCQLVQVVDRDCSAQCGCASRYVEFSPVCLLDDLTTYPSPCHAGCITRELVDGLSVYVNCTCGGRGVAGACGADGCRAAYQLHQMLFVVLVAVTTTAMSTHGVVCLRAADARDRSAALGVCGAAMAALVAATHAFLAVAASGMCAVSAGGVCVVPSAGLPLLVGATSVVLVGISCLISAVVWLRLRRTNASI